jgi:hypothetical protein
MNTEITQQMFVRSYWNYYIELEEQLISTKRFVDFDRSNNKTFSIEYLKLLQATCSEIDVVAKIMAGRIDPSFKLLRNKNIQKWGLVIQNAFSNIERMTVRFNNDYDLAPWNNWAYEKYSTNEGKTSYRLINGKQTPEWWTAYNKVKHERTSAYGSGQTHYVRANLENLIFAMAALYILETLFLSSLADNGNTITYTKSKLFELLPDESR